MIQRMWMAAAAGLMIAAAAQAASRPNVVVILADDSGWGDYSSNGNTNLSTPNIDSLGKQGATLDRFFVCPVCSPTRAEFLTGRYHLRGGVYDVSTGGERLNLDEKTIADTFKAAGYATGAFGKWHNGTQYPYHPNGRGFDEYYGFTHGHWGSYFDTMMDHNGKLTTGKGFIIDDLTDHAMQFISDHKEGNFFCYLPLNTPHTPAQVPDKYYDKFRNAQIKMRAQAPRGSKIPAGKKADAKKEAKGNKGGKGGDAEDPQFTKAVLAMMENIDWNVGRLLARLDELKLAENTIVLYFSDNGPNSWRWNDNMKGKKGSTDEGGVRSAFVIRWPGKIPAGQKVTQIAGAIDLLPTLTDMAGVPVISAMPLDGKSLKPLLTGSPRAEWADRPIYSHWGGKFSMRTQQYRLSNDGELFDMVADPSQYTNVASVHPEIFKRLSAQLDAFKQEMPRDLRNQKRPFPVGHPQFPLTQLEARDGVGHGNIKRSANAPNCSYFTNWTSPSDSITWHINVANSGKYDVQVLYTCPAADVGSTIELSFNGSAVQGAVSQPNDPPAKGMENDRYDRAGESYVKDFAPLNLGEIELKAGQGELALKALKMPGKSVMEVRMVLLTLKK